MAFVNPQLIPKKKENGGQGIANWRQSPALKPATSPKPLPVDAPTSLTPSPQSTEGLFEDHIVHIYVSGVTRIDMEKVLLPEVGYATSHAFGHLLHIGKPTTIPLEREGVVDTADSKNESLTNLGPAAHFKTPKTDLIMQGTPIEGTPDAPPAVVNRHGLPAMELPPAAGTPTLSTPTNKGNEELFVAIYATNDAAENAKHLVKTSFPRATVTITTRKRGSTNSTLVLKGVPFQTRIESLVDNLTNHLTFKPSYTRLHRSERGVFKCVIFLKFSTRAIAELSKYELERITVGTRPLRVEFKKHQREGAAEAHPAPAPPTPASAPSAPTSIGSLPPPAYGAVKSLLNPPPAYSPTATPAAPTVPYTIMEQTISAIALGDYGGCVYSSNELKAEDIRYLAHLCTVNGLQLITATPNNVPPEASISLLPVAGAASGTGPQHLLIRKRPPTLCTSTPGGGIMDRSSPQAQPASTPKFTPRIVPTTPQWMAHTPGSLQPMDFRGIRHWKEVRQETTTQQASAATGAVLGIIRPLGPESGTPFGAGRGRPVR